jgi:hypothetical protein
MNKITVLGSGLSSVAGMDWFLVGYGGQDVFVVTCDHMTDEIEVRTFGPGQKQLGDGSLAHGTHVDEIIQFCKTLKPLHDLNWDDKRKASELYWSYKEESGG